MAHLLWDASALVKRYYTEIGQDAVNTLFQLVAPSDMMLTPWGYAEVYAILLRKRNSGALSPASFNNVASKLQGEALGGLGFNLLSINDATIFGSLSLMETHNLNSADAAILATYLRFQRTLPVGSDSCLLVASDKRLVRAAEKEGLKTLNPELALATHVAAFLAAL